MSEPVFKDHFSRHSAGYAAHRPTYPRELVDYLADLAPGPQWALDAGCGTGQLSVKLAERFARVVATDASAAQIGSAEAHPRVEYRVAVGAESGLPAGSVDLITVAQAAHWFALPPFYAEVRRVARPGAVLALITYGALAAASARVEEVVRHFHYDVLDAFWPPERQLVEQGYRTLDFPFPELAVPPLEIRAEWPRAAVQGYIGTWSAVKEITKAQGAEPFERFARELAEAWPEAEEAQTIRWPLALRVGRVSECL